MKTKHITPVWLSAATIALLASAAIAQVRQVQQGNVLDANMGMNSGGSNRPVPGYVPINGNDVISGNVSGLQYFHGQVNTISPFVFRGQLGTGYLQDFARQSAPSGPAGSTGYSQSYFLPSSMVSTAQGALYSAPFRSGFDSALVPQNAISPVVTGNVLRSAAPLAAGVPMQAYNRQVEGMTPITPGSPGAVTASPLFSLRVEPQPAALPTDLIMPSTTLPAATMPEVPESVRTRSDMLQAGGLSGGLIDGRVGIGANGTGPNTAIDAAVPHEQMGDLTRVSDTYRNLVDELKRAQGPPEDTLAGPGGAATQPSLGGADIDILTNQQRRISMLSGKNGMGAATRPGGRMPVEMPASRLEDTPTGILQAGKDVKPLDSLTRIGAGEPTTFETLMARAEVLLKDSKYLDAADAYQSALAVQPDNALALVGRAHAEIGAGMYQSAAYDLKFLFTRKPEMVSVHYRMQVFIPTVRQDQLLADLASMTTNKDGGNTASFLYCYLCYQTGRLGDMQTELRAWGNRPGHDTWQSVLSRAWGGSAAGK